MFPTSEGDGFAAVFNEDCSNLLFATYIGGIHDDVVYAIASDSDGNLIVAGTTFSPDFPVTLGAFDSSLGVSGSGFDGFVTRIDLQNNVFSSSSYLGGNDHDTPRDIAIAKNGDAIVVGNSYSDDFPIVGTVQDRCGWFCDLGFVTRITPDATKLVYSVWYGGASSSVPEEVRVLADDSVVFAGFTQNPNWPVTPGAFQADINQGVPNSWWDAFITHISADARRIFYSTFFGGEERDWGLGLAIDRDGSAILAGYTIPINFPTTPGTYQTSPTIPHITNAETFAARLSLLPAGLDRYGAPTATCSDDPLQIFAYSMPAVRNLDFCLRCIGADPAAPGVMLLGPKSLPAGPLNSGIRIWVEAQQAKIMLLSADAHGAAEVALPIPGIPSLAGLVGYTQFIFHDDCAPGALTASGGLAITIQP